MTHPDKCSIEGCSRPRSGKKEICSAHYQRKRLYGNAEYPYRRRTHKSDVCEVESCDRTDYGGHGYCTTHYYRYRTYGNPLAERAIKEKGANGSGYISHQGYRMMNSKRSDGSWKKVAEHRLVMERLLGRELFGDENVHHKNGDRLDNREENLELWSHSQPSGQRVEDKLEWALMIVARYGRYAPTYEK